MKKRLSVCILAILSALLIAAVAADSSSTFKKIISINFKGSGSYTWPTTLEYPTALSVDMTFKNGSYTNTFYVGYIRDGIQHDMISYTANMHTLVWYIPSRYLFKSNDQIVWSNSVAQQAVFTLNTDSQF